MSDRTDRDAIRAARTQNNASLNATQWRLVDSAVRHGYTWWLQEGGERHVVIGRDVERPYSERTLFVYRSGTTSQGATVFLASPDARMKQITQRAAYSLLSNRTL